MNIILRFRGGASGYCFVENLVYGKEYYFFENDQTLSSTAKKCFDNDFHKMLVKDGDLKNWDEMFPGIP